MTECIVCLHCAHPLSLSFVRSYPVYLKGVNSEIHCSVLGLRQISLIINKMPTIYAVKCCPNRDGQKGTKPSLFEIPVVRTRQGQEIKERRTESRRRLWLKINRKRLKKHHKVDLDLCVDHFINGEWTSFNSILFMQIRSRHYTVQVGYKNRLRIQIYL